MMEFLFRRSKVKDIILILIGTFLMAISINFIFDPMQMVTGGVTGLAIIVKDVCFGLFGFEVPVWLSNLAFNIPLFLLGFFVLGFRFIAKTSLATAALTLFLYIVPVLKPEYIGDDLLLAAVFGGLLAGVGIGLVFYTMTTTGGTDMLGMLIHKKKPHYSVPQLLMIIDGLVVLCGAAIFGIRSAMYAIIAVYICSKISGGILDGMKFAKSAYIISDYYQEIAEEILSRLDRGVTGLSATGMYSKTVKNVLFCVVSKKEMIVVIDIVHKIDPQAFVILSDVREVMGEGFIEFKQ